MRSPFSNNDRSPLVNGHATKGEDLELELVWVVAGYNHQGESELASDQIDPVLEIEIFNTRPIAIIDRMPLNFDDRQFYVPQCIQSVAHLAREIVAKGASRARPGPFVDMNLEQAMDEALEILLSMPFPILRSLTKGSLPANKVFNLLFML